MKKINPYLNPNWAATVLYDFMVNNFTPGMTMDMARAMIATLPKPVEVPVPLLLRAIIAADAQGFYSIAKELQTLLDNQR